MNMLLFITENVLPKEAVMFNITEMSPLFRTYSITFDWISSGTVENYIIEISPKPPFTPATSIVKYGPWNVTLSYDTVYLASITGLSCGGRKSPTVTIRNIYG